MPRLARLDAPSLLQHVMARGIKRREIFKDDKDLKSFLIRRQNPLLAKQPNKLNGPDKPNKPEKALAEKTIEDVLLNFGETNKVARKLRISGMGVGKCVDRGKKSLTSQK